MVRFIALPVCIFFGATLLAQDELPKDPSESFDIEPPLLIQEIPARNSDKASSEAVPANDLDPERLSAAVEKAKKSAAAGERLYKSGIIAKVDAENRALKVIRLESELSAARLEIAKQNVAAQQSRFDAGEISRIELELATSAVAEANTEAETAAARRGRAELEAALMNLNRQKKLLALGSGRKSEVTRAQEKVAQLQGEKN